LRNFKLGRSSEARNAAVARKGVCHNGDVTEWISERLVPGGLIAYDDYDTTPGVARYVDAQLPIKDRIVLHNLNGHAIAIKRQRRKTPQ
jgi:hypothetical protein